MVDTRQQTTQKENIPGRAVGDGPASPGQKPIVCPMCGGENAADAIFCGNPECHKALGEFKYVIEELPGTRWHETLAERVTTFMGMPHFLAGHFAWFLLWVAVNTGVIAIFRVFDAYPFGFLGIILTAEAIFITGCVLISQNRQSDHANKRAELDYEVNVRTYREILEMRQVLDSLAERVNRLESGADHQDPPAEREP